MQNNIQLFNFENHEVRTALFDNEPYLCLKDVCEVLDIKNISDCKSRLKKDGVGTTEVIDSMGRTQAMNFINEGNLYRVIFQSRKPNAEAFQDWVFEEVLPTIRKTGGYNLPTTFSEALRLLADETEQKERLLIENSEMKPKALFADAITSSNKTILIGELAKILKQNGIEMGQQRLFEYLRNEGYLIKRKGSDWNMPTQRSMELGLFEIKESVHLDGNGCNVMTKTTKVTPKGQSYFINRFLGD